MESINRMAVELADEAVEFAGELDVGAFDLENGATVLDFGVEHTGGIEAGLLLAEIQTAGLATVQTGMDTVAGAPVTHVELACDRPDLALLCSQKAGWELSVDGYEALGSGPARALVAEEAEFRELGYTDAFDLSVLTLESDALPTEGVADLIAERAEVNTDGLYLPAYAAASTAGSVSAAARAAEMATFRLFEAGYDPQDVRSVNGRAPVAPVAGDESTAIARGMDALAYGGEVYATVETDDSEAFEAVPSTAGEEYGRPLGEVFDDVEWDFAEVAAGVFGPAQVTVNVVGGPTYALGGTDEEVLAESFGL
ncbi:methenyltetrahydromethanopterin cyclohydrolase [Halarchaeum rubridurum]|uniref:Methenyltetrahydromethanopterin cyclohydrolase n=1 Tax=Halarchaeum rubridurum TaxID=489911 RepID=A0A830FXR1_9EURY|nr:methenyltetrahydromethanopterin cyclohydrolase [Halarchaeum rubridurum]MBP1953919.1 methenyltetrahydromethanopterin cyclohydrolase [Halarchaeum rubridurum]GGM55845.1 N(5),N(10)-methenyltetrahydromethanopterin cyclohydrolase [Halarchaeum rubridurum]